MSDGVFTAAKGAVAEWARDHSGDFGILLLKEAEADGDLRQHETVEDMLDASGNTEADFTNYDRKTGLDATATVDQGDNEVWVDMEDVTWDDAGGSTDNDLAKLVVFWDDGGSDDTRYLVTHHDFKVGTGGGDLTAQISSDGIYAAT